MVTLVVVMQVKFNCC